MSNIFNITCTQFIVERASDGKKYEFRGLHTFTIENPQMTHLTRGSDGLDRYGIEYSEGNSQPIVVTAVVRTTQNFFPVFQGFYKDQTRINVTLIDRNDARVIRLEDALLQKLPMQASIEESEDSVNVEFVFESFKLNADYKGGEF
ncbi:MAG: hypothetical protein LBC07_00100 [Elusimicrobiota bacterium]|jgi:hypothetical protein|nr:hypothetical protein [Elusimicrobiota bacterium]